ncbi:MAG: hypothetical protein ACRDIB_17670 [Ardenticatenaceae bacterium]
MAPGLQERGLEGLSELLPYLVGYLLVLVLLRLFLWPFLTGLFGRGIFFKKIRSILLLLFRLSLILGLVLLGLWVLVRFGIFEPLPEWTVAMEEIELPLGGVSIPAILLFILFAGIVLIAYLWGAVRGIFRKVEDVKRDT